MCLAYFSCGSVVICVYVFEFVILLYIYTTNSVLYLWLSTVVEKAAYRICLVVDSFLFDIWHRMRIDSDVMVAMSKPSHFFILLRVTAYMLSAHMLSQFRLSVRPSVCPSVRLSHGWISRKRLKLGSCNFHRTVAPSL